MCDGACLFCHRPNPRKGQKSCSRERVGQSSARHGLEETAAVPALSSSQQTRGACTGKRQTLPLNQILAAAISWFYDVVNWEFLSSLFPFVTFRTLKNPKTGTRQCSNRYTKYLVGLSIRFCVLWHRFACFTCRSVTICMWCHMTLCVCCLSITVLRVHWGKPLSPHLHFSWELWHSGEIKRYQAASAPLSGFTNLDLSQTLELCASHKCIYLIMLKVFQMFSLNLLSCLICISAMLF